MQTIHKSNIEQSLASLKTDLRLVELAKKTQISANGSEKKNAQKQP